MLPHPETLLLGSDATRPKFLSLPLNRYDVLHLSLHGYPDMEFPDRSALVFAPSPQLNDSGFLQAREIRNLHLNARLVTLSACKTSVGPTYETGAASIVNAFVEAGAQSVVSTLWDVDDRAGRKLMESFYKHLATGEAVPKRFGARRPSSPTLGSRRTIELIFRSLSAPLRLCTRHATLQN